MATFLAVAAIVLSALSSILHLPSVQKRIAASKTKADDIAVRVIDEVKDQVTGN